MKQKILIPDQAYDLKNNYSQISTPITTSQYVLKGYVVTPKDPKIFKLFMVYPDKEVVLNLNLKKDPRRSKSTKENNPLLFSFATAFKDQSLNSDLTINMPSNSDTTLNLIFNQFLMPISDQNNKNLTLTLNGSLGNLYIDRSNPFKIINVNTNNLTELFSKKDYGMWSRRARINIIDNTIEELNLCVDSSVPLNKKPSYYIGSLQSYSLKKIKLEGQVLDVNSSIKNYLIPNIQEIDLTKVNNMNFKYTNFLTNLINDDKFEHFNKNVKIKLNPLNTVELFYTEHNKPITIKEIFNLNSDKTFEITLENLVKTIKDKKAKKEKETIR